MTRSGVVRSAENVKGGLRVRALAAAVLMAMLAAGCGEAAPQSAPIDASPVVPRPRGVADPAAVPSGAPAPTCDPRASLRPPGELPPQGRMPPGTPMATIANRGRLVVGVSQTGYLLGFRDPESGEIIGFDIDIAREIARAIFGRPDAIQLVALTSAQRIPAIRDGTVDIVVQSMTITCDRLQQVAFSTEYLTAGNRVLVNRSSGFRSIGDLGGRKVCAPNGTTALSSIRKAASQPVAVSAETTADCLVMLQQGQVDAVCNDDTILAGLASQDPTTEIVGPLLSDEPYGVAISRDAPEMVRFVNAVLEQVRLNGTWATSYARWFDSLGPTPPPPQARYLD